MLTADEAGGSCSLGAQELRRRLTAIEALGRVALIGRGREGDVHVLRFRAGAATRRALERIVAAERECCPQLTLQVGEASGDLVLRIAGAGGAGEAADQLADAFERGPRTLPAFRPIPIDPAPGGPSR